VSSLIVRGDTQHLPLRNDSVDAIVTDPPYMIGIATWDHPPADPTTRHLSHSERIICWAMDWGHEAWRVLRPGGYLFVFSSKRTIHLIASSLPIDRAYNDAAPLAALAPSEYAGGLEMAGFQCLGFLHWVYGTGQPRPMGHGAARETIKPAWEPIAVLAKPPVPWTTRTVAPNVEAVFHELGQQFDWDTAAPWLKALRVNPSVREVLGITQDMFYVPKPRKAETNKGLEGRKKTLTRGTGWTKSKQENPHESKKPVDLMERLVRYACPEGGLVLDPFCGSGSTGVASVNVGRHFIGVEREADYSAVAAQRVASAERDAR
jgi:site-specific DNA-methyltransferase (adenine-specific)